MHRNSEPNYHVNLLIVTAGTAHCNVKYMSFGFDCLVIMHVRTPSQMWLGSSHAYIASSVQQYVVYHCVFKYGKKI